MSTSMSPAEYREQAKFKIPLGLIALLVMLIIVVLIKKGDTPANILQAIVVSFLFMFATVTLVKYSYLLYVNRGKGRRMGR